MVENQTATNYFNTLATTTAPPDRKRSSRNICLLLTNHRIILDPRSRSSLCHQSPTDGLATLRRSRLTQLSCQTIFSRLMYVISGNYDLSLRRGENWCAQKIGLVYFKNLWKLIKIFDVWTYAINLVFVNVD